MADLLDDVDDVAAWLWNDQAGVQFRVQYAFEGKTPYYYPDFLVRLSDGAMAIVGSKGSIRERDRAKRDRTERHVDLLRVATGQPWSYLILINDAAIGRQDVAWWRSQGRTLFRDLVRHVDNVPEPGATLAFRPGSLSVTPLPVPSPAGVMRVPLGRSFREPRMLPTFQARARQARRSCSSGV